MRHNRLDKRFSRPSGHLRCMMANLTNDLLSHGRIMTTTAKAKLLRRYAERMVTLGKNGDISSRRRAMAFLRNKGTVEALFGDIAPRYTARSGGYTRILKVGVRPGDCAAMSFIELVRGGAVKKEEPGKTPAGKKAAKSGKEAKAEKKK